MAQFCELSKSISVSSDNGGKSGSHENEGPIVASNGKLKVIPVSELGDTRKSKSKEEHNSQEDRHNEVKVKDDASQGVLLETKSNLEIEASTRQDSSAVNIDEERQEDGIADAAKMQSDAKYTKFSSKYDVNLPKETEIPQRAEAENSKGRYLDSFLSFQFLETVKDSLNRAASATRNWRKLVPTKCLEEALLITAETVEDAMRLCGPEKMRECAATLHDYDTEPDDLINGNQAELRPDFSGVESQSTEKVSDNKCGDSAADMEGTKYVKVKSMNKTETSDNIVFEHTRKVSQHHKHKSNEHGDLKVPIDLQKEVQEYNSDPAKGKEASKSEQESKQDDTREIEPIKGILRKSSYRKPLLAHGSIVEELKLSVSREHEQKVTALRNVQSLTCNEGS